MRSSYFNFFIFLLITIDESNVRQQDPRANIYEKISK